MSEEGISRCLARFIVRFTAESDFRKRSIAKQPSMAGAGSATAAASMASASGHMMPRWRARDRGPRAPRRHRRGHVLADGIRWFVNEPSEWRPIAAQRLRRRPAVHHEIFFLGNTRFPAQKIAAQLICPCVGAFGHTWNNTQVYRLGTFGPVRRTDAQTQSRPTDWGGPHETNDAWVCYVQRDLPAGLAEADIEAHIFACCPRVGGYPIET
jgi:hypothetical protein